MQPIIRRTWAFPTDAQLKGKDGSSTFKGVKQLRDTLADHVEKVGTALTEYHLVDVLANRPAPAKSGRHFYATDTQTMYEDTSTSWVPIGGTGTLIRPFNITVVTTSTLLASPTNLWIADTTANDITLTLPAATATTDAFWIKKPTPTHNLIIQPAGTDTLDGVAYPSGYLVTAIWRQLGLVDYKAGGWAILG